MGVAAKGQSQEADEHPRKKAGRAKQLLDISAFRAFRKKEKG